MPTRHLAVRYHWPQHDALEVATALSEGTLYAVDCEAARQMADATGIWTDLDYAVDELTRLQGEMKREPRDVVVERALWTSAIVHYGRCFVEGRRTPADGLRWPLPSASWSRRAAHFPDRDH